MVGGLIFSLIFSLSSLILLLLSDVPQQLCTKLDHVQSLAKSVNTNVYRAADILETLNSAFVYGRSASSDPFQLEEVTKKSLDSFDSSFKRFLEGRVNAEFDQADQELTKCKQSVGEWTT